MGEMGGRFQRRRVVVMAMTSAVALGCGAETQRPGEPPAGDVPLASPELALPDVGATPGSRLRPMIMQPEGAGLDGPATLVGWWDQELEHPCRFQRDRTELRCVPSSGGLVYLDAECTVPVIVSGVARPEWAQRSSDDQVFRALDDIEADTFYERTPKQGGTCEAKPLDDGWMVGAAPVEMEVFARAVEVKRGHGRLQRVMGLGDDGAMWVGRAWDSLHEWTCGAAAGSTRCRPSSYPVFELFADESCSALAGEPHGARAFKQVEVEACVTTTRYFRRGAPISIAYESSDAGCEAVAVEGAFAVGAELFDHDFPEVLPMVMSDGRLWTTHLRDPLSDARVSGNAWHFHDLETDHFCHYWGPPHGGYRLAEGRYACLPAQGEHTIRYYADAACTKPGLYTTAGTSCSRYYINTREPGQESDEPPATREVLELVDLGYELDADGECVPAPGFSVRRLSEPLDLPTAWLEIRAW